MSVDEQQFIVKVKSLIDGSDALKTIEALAGLEKPGKTSLNTQTLIDYIINLEYEREDGKLDGVTDDFDKQEQAIASENLQKIKRVLNDIDKENWYKKVYWSELAYSSLKDGEYTYKLAAQKLNALSLEEAETEIAAIKTFVPKVHPDDNDYKLEDVRINLEIIDSNGVTVEPPRFLKH